MKSRPAVSLRSLSRQRQEKGLEAISGSVHSRQTSSCSLVLGHRTNSQGQSGLEEFLTFPVHGQFSAPWNVFMNYRSALLPPGISLEDWTFGALAGWTTLQKTLPQKLRQDAKVRVSGQSQPEPHERSRGIFF